ncbi:hypothetical protein F2Q69_00052917 [Brassica cretica]|uniref:Uncharacterized protein n=1 Tax=Brassica cretica TaxID=69181 RepID=A0A8S9N207_BRACR|nr:hypothetical protein F2Q69_00052917 [Brassica cretica]
MTSRLKTCLEQPDRTDRPLNDCRVVRASNHSTIVEWSAQAGHSTIIEWSAKQATRRSSSGLTIEPLDDRRVVCPETPI